MQVTFKSWCYVPEDVTGRYARVIHAFEHAGRFKVLEVMTAKRGPFKGIPGMGPTIREYITDGAELPADIRERCVATGTTQRLD